MPVLAPGSTVNRPPHRLEATPTSGAMAANRRDPEVCAVPRSKRAGLTMLTGGYVFVSISDSVLSTCASFDWLSLFRPGRTGAGVVAFDSRGNEAQIGLRQRQGRGIQ